MSVEAEQQYSYAEQPVFPELELRTIIEGMKPDQRLAEKARLLAEISDRESIVNAINLIQEAEGYSSDIE